MDVYVLNKQGVGNGGLTLLEYFRACGFTHGKSGSIVTVSNEPRDDSTIILAQDDVRPNIVQGEKTWRQHLDALLVVLQEQGVRKEFPTLITHIGRFEIPGTLPEKCDNWNRYQAPLVCSFSGGISGYDYVQKIFSGSATGERRYNAIVERLTASGKFIVHGR